MCKARVTLRCPLCKRKLEVTRPDSLHSLCSLEKPEDFEVEGDVVTQVYACKNPDCKSSVPVFWYEAKMSFERK